MRSDVIIPGARAKEKEEEDMSKSKKITTHLLWPVRSKEKHKLNWLQRRWYSDVKTNMCYVKVDPKTNRIYVDEDDVCREGISSGGRIF